MELTEHSCKRCGGSLTSVGENRWKCQYCGRIYDEEAAVKNTKTMREMFDETKMEIVKNLRRNLYDAVNAEYISSSDVKGACIALKKYLPDDFAANFYEVAVGNNVRALTQHIRKIDVEKNLDEIESVIVFLIKSLQTEYLLELNNLVEKAYKNRDLALFEKYATLISTEAEKVQNGIYETKLPREVFIAYSSKDMDKVSVLCEVLEAQGLHCFVAARNLRHGKGSVENYDSALKEAMDHCKSFVFVSSMNSRQFSCDALGIEIPYIETLDRNNAPAEYRNNYIAIPHKFKKPRCEYRVEESRGFNAADSITNEFFDGYERVYSPEEVAKRILKQLVEVPATAAPETPTASPSTAAPKKPETKKICVGCGTENAQSASYCIKCGKKQFVSSVSEYIKIKNAQDLEESRKREAAARAASSTSSASNTQKKKGKGGIIAAVIAVAVVIVVIIAIASSAGSKSQENPLPDNNVNGGIIYNPDGGFDVIYPNTSEKPAETEMGDQSPEEEESTGQNLIESTYENLSFTVTHDGVMTISGSGDMPEFDESTAPWFSDFYLQGSDGSGWWACPKDYVHTIIIDEGITSVGSYAFYNFYQLRQVQLPESVKRIGDYAFRACNSEQFTTIDLSHVTDIGKNAFYECYSLSEVLFGESIEHMGEEAFHNTQVINNYMNDSGMLIMGDCLVKANSGYGNELVIPDGIVCIADYACIGNYSLTSIVIPETVKYIGAYAFNDCDEYQSITIPSSVISIGDNAFEGNDGLRSVTIAKGSQLERIGKSAFSYCYALSDINLQEATLLTDISDYAFYNCEGFVDIVFPSQIKNIGSYAFASCDSLASVMIPVSLESIGEYSFSNNSYLDTIVYNGSEEQWELISKGGWWNQNAGEKSASGSTTVLCMNGTYDPDSAEDYTPGLKFAMNADGSGYKVISYTGTDEEVIIPATHLGFSVTEIGNSAFTNNTDIIKSVYIPASVKKIDSMAFSDIDTLLSVVFAEGSELVEIGDSAFSSCGNLPSIKIPKTVTFIGNAAFASCVVLSSVEFEEGIALEEIGESVFSDTGLLKSINIPDSVTKIGNSAFSNSGIESLTFGKNSRLTTIISYAFNNCDDLKSVAFPPSLTEVDTYAFQGCEKIEYLSVSPNQLGYIYKGSVKTLVIIGEGEITDSAVYGCSNLESVTLGDGITAIGSSAFYNCSGLTEIILGSGIASIGENAFYSCDVLKSIVIPDTVVSIGSSAFASSEALSSVTLGNGVTSIGSGCFEGCSSLRSIELPSTLESIGSSAFASSGIESITIPEGITEIADYTFMHCENLTTVVIPNSVTSVGGDTFYNTKIKNISFPIGIASSIPKSDLEHIAITDGNTIPSYTFDGCTKLQSVKLPDTQGLIIGAYAFRGCISLMSITLPETLEDIAMNAFENCHALAEVINHTSQSLTVGDTETLGGVAGDALIVHSGEESLLDETEDGFVFISVDGVHHVIGYIGNATDIVFPESYNGESYQVRARLFHENTSITSIEISGVETIPEGLCYGCYSLKSVTIGDGVKHIDSRAFYDCDAVETVVIGNDVISIGDEAFSECHSIKTLTLGSSLESIGNSAFYYCSNALERVVIPASVTHIGSQAFYYCSHLSGVKFEDSSAQWELYSNYSSGDSTPDHTVSVSSSVTNADNLRESKYYYIWKKVVD